jgi:beta-lactamase regulating signal transducer with metallopeptidase domain
MSQNWTPPPAGGAAGPGGAPPNNYLIPAILVTLFCCLPGGIVAIINATKVNSAYAAGDVQGAMNASANALKWVKISVGVGIVWIVIIIIANVFGMMASR